MLSREHQPGSCTTVVAKYSAHKKTPQVQVSPEGAEHVSPAAPTIEQSSPTRPQSAAEAEASWEGADSEMVEGTKLYSPIGNEVFLGSGVWLQKSIYGHLMQRPKDGIFVREASVQVYSTAGLMNRSVTGAASNRTKTEAKPPLDAIKYDVLKAFFRHYLERRCSNVQEIATRQSCLGKVVACKIPYIMKGHKKHM
ncbi:BEN domain-containing protein 5-like [Dermacentor andersoni]